ncbi:MAG: hypothetical protein ACFB15_31240 [Cyclobacteriaceae bacterium]
MPSFRKLTKRNNATPPDNQTTEGFEQIPTHWVNHSNDPISYLRSGWGVVSLTVKYHLAL